MIGIYCIINNKNSKRYIGSSVDIEKRWTDHVCRLNSGSHRNDYLQKSWNRNGSTVFSFIVVEECKSELLPIREKYWIDFYNSINEEKGYNLTTRCEGRAVENEATKRKRANSARDNWKNQTIREKMVESIKDSWANPTKARKFGAVKSGHARRDKRQVGEYDLNSTLIKVYSDRREAWLSYNKDRNVYKVLEGKLKTYHNKTFKYIEDSNE